MTTMRELLPTGMNWRELWDAQNISGVNWPSSVSGGHPITLTAGAHKATTTKGLIMRGAELVTITDPAALAIVDNLTIIFPAFKLNTLFSAASGADMGIMNFNNGSVVAHLESTTGAMDILFKDADGGADETVSTTKVSWAADTEWQVGFTYVKAADATISVKVYINGVAEVTNAHCDTDLTDGAGDTTYGYDGTTYLTGTITRGPKAFSTAALTAAEMLLEFKGIPEASNCVLYHMLNEGRGLTIDDKITGAACDGVISGTNTDVWDYGVKQAVMGVDGVTDYGVSTAGIDISGAVSLVHVVKAGTTYGSLGSSGYAMEEVYIDANNGLFLYYYHTDDVIRLVHKGGGTSKNLTYSTKPAIGDYLIFIGTVDASGNVNFYVNGSLADTETGGGTTVNSAATAYMCRGNSTYYGQSPVILSGIVHGALSGKEALDFSRKINSIKGLGLTI